MSLNISKDLVTHMT